MMLIREDLNLPLYIGTRTLFVCDSADGNSEKFAAILQMYGLLFIFQREGDARGNRSAYVGGVLTIKVIR
jgi:hypothetical protein